MHSLLGEASELSSSSDKRYHREIRRKCVIFASSPGRTNRDRYRGKDLTFDTPLMIMGLQLPQPEHSYDSEAGARANISLLPSLWHDGAKRQHKAVDSLPLGTPFSLVGSKSESLTVVPFMIVIPLMFHIGCMKDANAIAGTKGNARAARGSVPHSSKRNRLAPRSSI